MGLSKASQAPRQTYSLLWLVAFQRPATGPGVRAFDPPPAVGDGEDIKCPDIVSHLSKQLSPPPEGIGHPQFLFPDTHMHIHPRQSPGTSLGSPGSVMRATLPQPPPPKPRVPSSPYLGRRARSRRAGGRAAVGRRGSWRRPEQPASGPWRAQARRRGSRSRNARHAHR